MSQDQKSKLTKAVKPVQPHEVDIPQVNAQANIDTSAVTGTVTIIHGAEEQSFDVSGKSVAYVRENLGDVFNVPRDADALVNGQPVTENHTLNQQDVLEFVKQAGVKG